MSLCTTVLGIFNLRSTVQDLSIPVCAHSGGGGGGGRGGQGVGQGHACSVYVELAIISGNMNFKVM